MKLRRSVTIAFIVTASCGFAAMTYQEEHQTRYHLDTLREERYATKRVIGIPVHREMTISRDPHGLTYREITGKNPDPHRWLQRRPDNIRSWRGERYMTYGFGFEFRERREQLHTLYENFDSGMPQEDALSLLTRINATIPGESGPGGNVNFEEIDILRRNLGLKPYHEQEMELRARKAAEQGEEDNAF